MPYTLANPITETIVSSDFKISSHTVDSKSHAIHIVYDKGNTVGGVFTPTIEDIMITVSGQEFIDTLTEFETNNTGLKRGDLKLALYNRIAIATGLTGVIS